MDTFKAHVDNIRVPRREGDPVQQDKVAALAKSIEDLGLRTPISVRRKAHGEFTYEIVAGRHRLAAMKRLGKSHIEARLEKGTEVDAEMWEVAENLHRTNMGTEAAALATVRWEALQALRLSVGESNSGPNRPGIKTAKNPKGAGQKAKSNSARATAAALGIGDAEVKRRRKVAAMDAEAKATLRDAGFTAQVDYLAVATAPKAEQAKAAEAYVKERKAHLAERAAEAAKPKAARVSELAKAWAGASDSDREAFVLATWPTLQRIKASQGN